MNNHKIKILLVEDSPGDARLVQEMLKETPTVRFEINQVDWLEKALERLNKESFDIILLDLGLPDSSGLDTLLRVRAEHEQMPVVVLTGMDDELLAMKAVESGAEDYIVKTQINVSPLVRSIRYAIERKRGEVELRKERDRAQKYLDVAEVIMVAIGVNQKITLMNKKGYQVLGYKEEELIGRNWFDTVIPIGTGDQVKKVFDRLIAGEIEPVEYYENTVLTKSGQELLIAWHNAILKDEKGNITGTLSSGEDITRRKHLEQVKDEFVSTVSHELRTPMTSIREVISQTLDGILGETTPEQRDFLSMALADIDRLSRIINDLLDISKIEAGKVKTKREMCNLVTLAQKAVSLFLSLAQAKGLEIQQNYSDERIKAYVDQDRITQVFSNLIGNAVKFTRQGHIEISVVDGEDAIECSVSDTGPGIAEKDLPLLFDKFQQFDHPVSGEEKGTGLGLAISKGIVELHQGKIGVESQVNVGTKFTFVLPKFAGKELISEGLKKAIKEGQASSVLIFDIRNFQAVQQKIGEEKAVLLVHTFWELIRDNLRREGDNLAVEDLHTILTILPGTEKRNALLAQERMKSVLRECLFKEGLNEEVDLVCEVFAFPDDGKTEEELFSKVNHMLAVQKEIYVMNK